jgi:hypothetical protein
MKPHEKFSAHLQLISIIATLASAILAAVAALLADPKSAAELSKLAYWYVIATTVLLVLTLTFSLYAAAALCNYLITYDKSSDAQRICRSRKITWRAGSAFFLLFFSALLLGAFIVMRISSRTSTVESPVPMPPLVKIDLRFPDATLDCGAGREQVVEQFAPGESTLPSGSNTDRKLLGVIQSLHNRRSEGKLYAIVVIGSADLQPITGGASNDDLADRRALWVENAITTKLSSSQFSIGSPPIININAGLPAIRLTRGAESNLARAVQLCAVREARNEEFER